MLHEYMHGVMSFTSFVHIFIFSRISFIHWTDFMSFCFASSTMHIKHLQVGCRGEKLRWHEGGGGCTESRLFVTEEAYFSAVFQVQEASRVHPALMGCRDPWVPRVPRLLITASS